MAEPVSSWQPGFVDRDDPPGSNDSEKPAFRILLIDPSALSRSCFIAALEDRKSVV